MTKFTKHHGIKGLTLLELLMALAIVSILLTVVAPAATDIVRKSKITAEINQLSAIIRYARTHAIITNNTVTICPSINHSVCQPSWTSPLIVFIDTNNNFIRDDNEAIITAKQGSHEQHKIKGPQKPIRFYETGTNASPSSLILCPIDNDNNYARAIIVSLQGRTRVSKDSNNDGIHERTKGNNINCLLI